MKDMAFGRDETAIEIFPSSSNLVDGAHQRHLWRITNVVLLQLPNLKTGLNIT